MKSQGNFQYDYEDRYHECIYPITAHIDIVMSSKAEQGPKSRLTEEEYLKVVAWLNLHRETPKVVVK